MAANAISILIQAKDQGAIGLFRKTGSAVDALTGNVRSNHDSIEKANASWLKTGAIVGAAAGVVSTVANRAFSELNSLIGDAVSRVDTLNNFPRIMSNFGVSADDANKMIKELDLGVRGLPTSLNDIVQLAQGFVPLTKNTDEATKTALALNNAILAGGAPAQVRNAAYEQFRQALAKGKPELQDWKSLEAAMPAQLLQVIDKLNLGSGALSGYNKNAMGLYNAMQDGKLTINDFNQALRDLNEKGINGLPNLQQQAKNATQGIATGFENAKTAAVRGVGAIIQAIGSGEISNTLSAFGKSVESALRIVASLVPVARSLAPAVGVSAASLAAFIIVVKATNGALALQRTYLAATGAQFIVLNGQLITVRGTITLATVAMTALNTAIRTNPIAFLIGAGVALVTTLFAMSTQTDSATGSTTRLANAQRDLKNATDQAKLAQDQLKGALLDQEGAKLNQERATRNLADAISTYGANSFQAREAAYELKRANDDLSQANDRVAQTTNAASQAEENRKQKVQDLANVQNGAKTITENYRAQIDLTRGAVDGLGGSADNSKGKLYTFNDSLKLVGPAIDVANGKLNTFNSSLGSSGKLNLNKHATGTPYSPGGLTLVGERGPELVQMPAGAKVTQAYRTRQELSQSAGVTINEHGTYIFNNQQEWDAQEARRDQTARLAMRGMA